ncbi:minor capsid protein [Enterococcus faecium]
MTVHVLINSDGYGKKLNEKNLDKALFALTNQAHADMNLYVPKRQGYLRDRSFVQNNRITYKMPYAKAQYRGYRFTKDGKKIVFRKYKIPGTGPYWDKKAKTKHIDSWRKAFISGGGFTNGH